MLFVNLSGKPDAGNPPVRFDEGDQSLTTLVPTLLVLMFFVSLFKLLDAGLRSTTSFPA